MTLRQIKRVKLSELVDQNINEIPMIELNKLISQNVVKINNVSGCLYCGVKNKKYCRSHTIPKFVLKNIATDGKVKTVNAILDLPILKKESGIANAGLFKLICQQCDSKIFNLYENESNYTKEPTQALLSQIVMKNSLADVYLRIQMVANLISMDMDHQLQEKDIQSEIKNFKTAVSNIHSENNPYHILFFKKLDYVVPVACQSIVVPVVDFEGNLLNDILNGNTVDNVLQLCIFPFEKESVVLLFMDKISFRNKYNNFANQIANLNERNKLSTINYLLTERQDFLFFTQEYNGKLYKQSRD